MPVGELLRVGGAGLAHFRRNLLGARPPSFRLERWRRGILLIVFRDLASENATCDRPFSAFGVLVPFAERLVGGELLEAGIGQGSHCLHVADIGLTEAGPFKNGAPVDKPLS
jgi:hypothetical protein